MSVAALMNIPTTDNEFNQWSFAHAAHHRDCIRATFAKNGTELAEYVLDPLNRGDGFGTWLYNHQAMHTAQNAALGTQGFDLTDTNWQDAGQLASWIQDNENEHYQWATILGVG